METHKMPQANNMHYKKLFLMAILSFISMFILMYSMTDKFSNVVININQFYMAGLMTAPMIIIEIILMVGMYQNKKFNALILTLSGALLISCFLFIRNQTGVSDKQFLKSMIPHHAAAILMVRETALKDPEVQKLAHDIISSQGEQIDFMKAKIKELEK